MKQKRPQAVKPAVFVSVGAKPRRRITRLALMLKQTKSLILCGIWRFFILIFTGRKGNINGSKKRQKHKKSRQKDFHRIERTLENTGFSRVPLAERMGFEPMCDCSQTDFESSGKNRTWRNLTEDNGRCENPENAVFSRLSAPVRIENTVKIRVRKSPPISPGSNGFSEKPIRIFDRTERFFAPKSRFWHCMKSPGYAGLHPKSCEKMPGRNQNRRYRQKYKQNRILTN